MSEILLRTGRAMTCGFALGSSPSCAPLMVSPQLLHQTNLFPLSTRPSLGRRGCGAARPRRAGFPWPSLPSSTAVYKPQVCLSHLCPSSFFREIPNHQRDQKLKMRTEQRIHTQPSELSQARTVPSKHCCPGAVVGHHCSAHPPLRPQLLATEHRY